MNDSSTLPPSNLSSTTSSPLTVNCPTCRKVVAWIDSEQYRPFCSKKCQLIDFGEWAAERHSIPAEDPPDGDEDSE